MPRTSEKGRKGRILVVDDQENLCWVLAKILSDRGHVVRTAQTAALALAALRDFDCQVAVVDYRLPDANGISLSIEMATRHPRLECILMTSYGSATVRESVRNAGLFAYFDKPFNNELMIETIEAAIHLWIAGDEMPARRIETLFPGRPIAGV